MIKQDHFTIIEENLQIREEELKAKIQELLRKKDDLEEELLKKQVALRELKEAGTSFTENYKIKDVRKNEEI